jgi:hypothetical protein
MSYREENGKVILTLTREDFENLMATLSSATASFLVRRADLEKIGGLVNRLNEGNPDYKPYQVHKPTAI